MRYGLDVFCLWECVQFSDRVSRMDHDHIPHQQYNADITNNIIRIIESLGQSEIPTGDAISFILPLHTASTSLAIGDRRPPSIAIISLNHWRNGLTDSRAHIEAFFRYWKSFLHFRVSHKQLALGCQRLEREFSKVQSTASERRQKLARCRNISLPLLWLVYYAQLTSYELFCRFFYPSETPSVML